MKLVLWGAAPMACAPTLLSHAALAAEPAAVAVPIGDWIVAAAHLAAVILAPILLGAALRLLATLPVPVRLFVTERLVERLVVNARDYALNAVEGAAKGKALSIPVGSAVVAEAVQRAVSVGAPWLVREAGGEAGIAAKVFRVLDLEPGATARRLGVE
jgi:hypothetical protein